MSTYLIIINNYNQIITYPYKFDLIHYTLSTMYLQSLIFNYLITHSLVYFR
jgi:hypothetical protein